jgi:hypothetical protein
MPFGYARRQYHMVDPKEKVHPSKDQLQSIKKKNRMYISFIAVKTERTLTSISDLIPAII